MLKSHHFSVFLKVYCFTILKVPPGLIFPSLVVFSSLKFFRNSKKIRCLCAQFAQEKGISSNLDPVYNLFSISQ